MRPRRTPTGARACAPAAARAGRSGAAALSPAARCAARLTVRFVPGATVNAERVELFANARESATRPDGAFFALEALRQVTLGYTREFNVPRVAVTDYTHVWTYRLLDGAAEGGGGGAVRATLSTAGYVQPNEALRYTADAAGGGPPQPQLGGLLAAATEPVVLYSHTVDMRRAPAAV